MHVDIRAAEVDRQPVDNSVLRQGGNIRYRLPYIENKHRRTLVYRDVVPQNGGERSYRKVNGGKSAVLGNSHILLFQFGFRAARKNKHHLHALSLFAGNFYLFKKVFEKQRSKIFVHNIALENGVDYMRIHSRPARKRTRLVPERLDGNGLFPVRFVFFDGNAGGFHKHHPATGRINFSTARTHINGNSLHYSVRTPSSSFFVSVTGKPTTFV